MRTPFTPIAAFAFATLASLGTAACTPDDGVCFEVEERSVAALPEAGPLSIEVGDFTRGNRVADVRVVDAAGNVIDRINPLRIDQTLDFSHDGWDYSVRVDGFGVDADSDRVVEMTLYTW